MQQQKEDAEKEVFKDILNYNRITFLKTAKFKAQYKDILEQFLDQMKSTSKKDFKMPKRKWKSPHFFQI